MIRIEWLDDEVFEVLVNDKYVGSFSYDALGWKGLQDVSDLLERLSTELDIPLVVDGEPGV